jgi:hypothetical protein
LIDSRPLAALNWPRHRGTATAFPLAAFGLSAFFFTGLSGILFPHSTSKILLLLAFGTFSMVFFSVYFMSVPETQEYEALSSSEHGDRPRRDSSLMHRGSSWRDPNGSANKPGKGRTACNYRLRSSNAISDEESDLPQTTGSTKRADEVSSLLSDDESIPGDIIASGDSLKNSVHFTQHREITGLALLPEVDFWLLFSLLGLLTGVGLMTINNIGHGVSPTSLHVLICADVT